MSPKFRNLCNIGFIVLFAVVHAQLIYLFFNEFFNLVNQGFNFFFFIAAKS